MNKLTKAPMTETQDRAILDEALKAITLMLYQSHRISVRNVGGTGSKQYRYGKLATYDEAALVEDEKLIVLQVNGKLRGKLTVAAMLLNNKLKRSVCKMKTYRSSLMASPYVK